jgi:hypothetical protein
MVRTFPIAWHSDMPGWSLLGNPFEKGKVMDKITRTGVDLAKNLIRRLPYLLFCPNATLLSAPPNNAVRKFVLAPELYRFGRDVQQLGRQSCPA